MTHIVFQEGAEIQANTPEEFVAITRRDIAKYSAVIRATGIKLE